MLFSSIPFLYYFLPCVFILYYLAPKSLKNSVLLFASLFFYGWGEPVYLIFMIVSILIGYLSGCLLEYFLKTKWAKWILIAAISVCLAFLGYFKYADFFIANVNAVTGASFDLLQIALPIGISFYTFQIISYIVDVYRQEVKAQKNIINLAAYVAMFPQLIAGPIVRYSDIEKQLQSRTHDLMQMSEGIRRFVLGLAKKILIANTLGELCDIFRESNDKSVLFFWIYAIAFSLHIYFDFSGYSDMAIGLGRMFGFSFPENFRYPYISHSITEFWRRWHISLGSWFRDYVYIPLGGNRVSKKKWIRNIFVVWILTGFWHGAAWNFMVWGLFFGILLMVEKQWFLKILEKHRIFGHVYVLLLVIISFVIFNAADMGQACSDILSMFGMGNLPLVSMETGYYFRSYGMTLMMAILGATPFVKTALQHIWQTKMGERILSVCEPIVLVILMMVMTAYLVDGSFNPFLYFRF